MPRPTHPPLVAIVATALLVSCPVAIAGAQEPVVRLSLEDAVRLAVQHNPVLRAKEAELRATRAGEITAALHPNPSASYSAEKFGSSGPLEHTATLGQTIETGGKRQRRVDVARAASRVTDSELADARRQTVYKVKKLFTDALVARASLGLAEQNLRTVDELEALQRIRVERGDLAEVELIRLRVQRFAFERDAGDARQALVAARIALRTTAGPEAIADAFEIVGDLTFRALTVDRGELLRRAVLYRPDLRAAQASREKARADLSLARASAWWDITPQLEYKRTDANEHTFGFAIAVPLRIFDRNQGEIARAQAEIDRFDALRRAAEFDVLADVDAGFAAALAQWERVVALRDVYLPRAQQARDVVEYAYRRGGASLLDFLDAQRSYRETALEHVRALGNYSSAMHQLEAATGQSLE